ncbi:hypothetical protein KA082_00150 [Candidatus Woesebacteria bacterium]|nr:hypothetical protein [Candidatus Woesebacteria bacterium]
MKACLTENQRLVWEMSRENNIPLYDAYASILEYLIWKWAANFANEIAEQNAQKELGSYNVLLELVSAFDDQYNIVPITEEPTTEAHALVDQYTLLREKIIATSEIVALDDWINYFNQYFYQYQYTMAMKMKPESLESGFITCSSAALLAGVCWQIETQIEPYFLLGSDYQSNPKAHVAAVLPRKEMTEEQIIEAILCFFDTGLNDDVQIIDFTTKKDSKGSEIMDLDSEIDEPHLKKTSRTDLRKRLSLLKGCAQLAQNRITYLK